MAPERLNSASSMLRPTSVTTMKGGRPRRGQGAGVLVGLVVGAQHGLVPAGGIEGPAGLLGFADEGTAAVEVDVPLPLTLPSGWRMSTRRSNT